jgi:[ribosomal protein S5]-alanine N-acetyltransferase
MGQTLLIADAEHPPPPPPPGAGDVPADDDAPPPPPPPQPFVLPWPPLQHHAAGVALRPWGAAPTDADALAAAWSDAEIGRWTSVPDARTRDDAARWVAQEGDRRDLGLALDLAITEMGSPEAVLGEIGLAVVEQERRWAEVGYWLFPPWRGAGRATSALRLLSGWALQDLPIKRLIVRTGAENPASGAVAERAGYDRAGELPDGTIVWVLDAVEP